MSSRVLNPTTPGGLLSPMTGGLTPGELLIIQAIEAGTFFVFYEVPTGAINDVNTAFVLAETPNPTTAVQVFLNGQEIQNGTDFTVGGTGNKTITFASAPLTGSVIWVNYLRYP